MALDLGFVVLRLLLGAWLLWRIPKPPGGPRRPTCSVIVPARNEAHALPASLSAVALQLEAGDELIVVDDHSRDGSAAVAVAAGAVVLSASLLPARWTGKAWACATGAAAAKGEVLCFVDADTTLAPGALDGLVRTQADGGGLVSSQPYHHVVRPYEQLSALFNTIALMGTDAHTPLGNRRRANGAYGPTVVVDAVDYRLLGGHGAVAGEVLDDVKLAQVWRGAGRAVRLYGGRSVSRFRMYPGGVGHLVEGWTKNFVAGARAANPLTTLLIAAWLSLPIQALWWVARLALPGGHAGGAALAGAVYAAVALELAWMWRRVGRFGVVTALLFPVPLVFFLGVFLRSFVLTVCRRPMRWKGRLVPTAARR